MHNDVRFDVDFRQISTLHTIAPYIGKINPALAGSLVQAHSKKGDIIMDPFLGSGTVALEALINGRGIIGYDINPYAHLLSKSKIEYRKHEKLTLKAIDDLFREKFDPVDLRTIPNWIRRFFHKRTLRELIVIVERLKKKNDFFLLGCLMGILHHQRPGFLSYPSSHLVPYLRLKKFPQRKFPDMYEYRDIKSRLISKVNRVYRNPIGFDRSLPKHIYCKSALNMEEDDVVVDAIITSPPYMNNLSYARDNRLRLWFLGEENYHELDRGLNSLNAFQQLMKNAFLKFSYVLKKKGICVIVLGDVQKNGRMIDVPNIVKNIAMSEVGGFEFISATTNKIPDNRRARRHLAGTKAEKIIVFKKT